MDSRGASGVKRKRACVSSVNALGMKGAPRATNVVVMLQVIGKRRHCVVVPPNVEGNRPAALTATKDQSMNRRVRLTVRLGGVLLDKDGPFAEQTNKVQKRLFSKMGIG